MATITTNSNNDVKCVKVNNKQTMKQKLHSDTIYKNRDNNAKFTKLSKHTK